MKKNIIMQFLAAAMVLAASCSTINEFDLPAGADGKDGRDGADGKSVSIHSIETLANGNILIIFTNEVDTWNLIIPQSNNGQYGLSVYDIWLLTVKPDECTTMECFLEAMRGNAGADGRDGRDGRKVLSNYKACCRVFN